MKEFNFGRLILSMGLSKDELVFGVSIGYVDGDYDGEYWCESWFKFLCFFITVEYPR